MFNLLGISNMTTSRNMIVLLSCLVSQSIIADNTHTDIHEIFKHNHAILQLGGAIVYHGTQQHINIDTLIGNQYTTSSKNSWNGLVGLGLLHDGPQTDLFTLAYGLNAFYLAKTAVTGAIYQENLFKNLNYSYNNTYYPVYALAKATLKNNDPRYAVTFDLGIGPDFIQTNRYKEQPLAENVVPDNAYSSNTTTVFSAIAGVGLKVNNAFGSLPLECGYRFFYLGQGELKANNNQYVDRLKTGYNYANAVMCGITI